MSIFPQSGGMRLNTPTCRWCAQPAAPDTDLCAYHASEAFRLVTQPQRAGYRDPAYGRARRVAIKRAKGKCEACGAALPRRPDGRVVCQTHHRDSDPTHNVASNLLVTCRTCHDGSRRPPG